MAMDATLVDLVSRRFAEAQRCATVPTALAPTAEKEAVDLYMNARNQCTAAAFRWALRAQFLAHRGAEEETCLAHRRSCVAVALGLADTTTLDELDRRVASMHRSLNENEFIFGEDTTQDEKPRVDSAVEQANEDRSTQKGGPQPKDPLHKPVFVLRRCTLPAACQLIRKPQVAHAHTNTLSEQIARRQRQRCTERTCRAQVHVAPWCHRRPSLCGHAHVTSHSGLHPLACIPFLVIVHTGWPFSGDLKVSTRASLFTTGSDHANRGTRTTHC